MKPVVVINAGAVTYSRYVGRICTNKFQALEEFPPQWIEEFRLDPVAFQSRFEIEEAPGSEEGPEAA